MKRVLSALFAMLLTLSALSACGGAETAAPAADASAQTDAAAETTTAEEVKVPTNGEIVQERYDGSDFGGYNIRVASIEPGQFPYNSREDINEIWFEKESGDVLNDAFYHRNAMTEEALNVVITPVWCGNGSDTQTAIQKSVLAGNDDYDLTVCRFDFQMNLAAQGVYVNISGLSPIDASDAWWNAPMTANATVNGKLFTMAGDLNVCDDYGIDIMLVNRRMADSYGIGDLYQAVRDGKWTLEYLTVCIEDTAVDLNGDGKLAQADDQFGFNDNQHAVMHLLFAFGEKLTDRDPDGGVSIRYGERLVDVVDAAYNLMAVNENTVIDPDSNKMFREGRVMILLECLSVLPKCRELEDDFSLLPCAKYDEAQDDYTAYQSNGTATAFSIPVTSADADRSAAVLDVLGGFGTETVRTAFNDYMLREKFLRDEESIEMLDNYIIGHGQYDLAIDLSWGEPLRTIYINMGTAKSNNFVSTFESKRESCQAKLDAFLAAFAD